MCLSAKGVSIKVITIQVKTATGYDTKQPSGGFL
jgi:hypothetical protein